MIWKALAIAARAAIHINHTVVAISAATVIVLGVRDYLKARKSKTD